MALSDYVDYGYSKAVWDNLMTYINNPIGVAAMMGNLFAESGIVPYRCEKITIALISFWQVKIIRKMLIAEL